MNSILGETDAITGLANVTVVTPSNLPSAKTKWQMLLGHERVITEQALTSEHGRNAYGSDNRSIAILRPRNESDVVGIVQIAKRFRIPLYPVSTGRNWGYGAASPTNNACAVVDLSDLCKIRMVDDELGIVALEPGVTQGMLFNYLNEHEFDLMVPVHGGGPSCSLLGNALERGYGLTPTTDHFAAMTSLRAVLPDGSIYQSPFHAMGSEKIGAAHAWGVGPYVEGLFSQGNFGIVTSATFKLKRRPEHVEAFFLRLADETQLGELVDHLRSILCSLGGSLAGVNLMNERRVLSMSVQYPVDELKPGEIISEQDCQRMSRKSGISKWTAAGVIHCPYSMRHLIRREIKRMLPRSFSSPIFMNRKRVRLAESLSRWLPIGGKSVLQQLNSIKALLDIADGIPQRVALPLAYWLRGSEPSMDEDLNPARDGCGLIWYSPLVLMKSGDVKQYVQMVHRVCLTHKIEPLITLTSLSEHLFDSTVPILFRPEIPGAKERARACHAELLEQGRRLGCLPYRVGTNAMEQLIEFGDGSHWHFVKKLKQAIDPHDLIAPGRYCPDLKTT